MSKVKLETADLIGPSPEGRGRAESRVFASGRAGCSSPGASSPGASRSDRLRIAFCLPEMQPLHEVTSGHLTDATFIVQGYIAAGLRARGHHLTYLAPRNLDEVICTTDLGMPTLAPRTWSRSRWFDLAAKGAWRVQRWLGVPYLNVFSDYRLYDACLRCLPGHDLVWERNILYKAGVAMACQRLRLPYVLFFEADDILEHDYMGKPITGLLRWRASRVIRYTLRAADCVVCVSKPAKDHLVSAWQVPSRKIVVCPNGVDVDRFRPNAEARFRIRTSLGLDANPLVLFAGSFHRWHDVSTLLEAFGHTSQVFPDARLVLVGEGEHRQAMLRLAANLGIARSVQFVGLVPHREIPKWIAAADVAVVPYPAGMKDLWLSPLKVFECMASGVPVVASALGQLNEVIVDGGNGLLVPPGEAVALASALEKLIDDGALRARLGQQARADAVRSHSWEDYAARLEHVYTAVIAGEPVDGI